jgi:4-alpha-glucanotransferase
MVGHYNFLHEDDFSNRIQAYLKKALREAKTHSDWAAPDEEYESATIAFAVALLDQQTPFWKSFEGFAKQVTVHGIINSLAQVLLKFTLPGVPDTYQGCEFWDYSFVDPDNRRAIDYTKRATLLESIEKETENLPQNLWQQREEGAIKLWLTDQLFSLRKSEASLFAEGDYLPLQIAGKYTTNILAFGRKQGNRLYIFAVPLHTAALCRDQETDFFSIDWADTKVVLPKEAGSFQDVFSGRIVGKGEGLLAESLFKNFPFAIIRGKEVPKERGAGILAHITSLPSLFGVGDLGPGAKAFVDFLHRSGQKYWQLLPLNPTEAGQGYSPYSALSSKAGWPLLISPELLARDGLLQADELKGHHLSNESMVDYAVAESVKKELLSKAFETFITAPHSAVQNDFVLFCEKEKGWLNDFALFMFLKKHHDGQPWYEWPKEEKKRDKATLQSIATQSEKALQKIKWEQFLFTKQWKELKAYCNNRNIRLIGDMPFYVSYDSADVWAAQHLFSIDEEGQLTGIAGVPPDAFSADGQLWGMPTFNWERMKQDGYGWWIQRLRKNIELFDLTRLDHFRAFAAYWQVPAGEETARNGKWIPAPGTDFFKAMQKEFGEVPFIAEDLGDINEEVLNLRDEASLPGMKVLQFAFGEDMPLSGYIPHNYDKNFLVYTGTHDNNTTVGWWKTEADQKMKARVENYAGHVVHEQNIHTTLARLAYASVANIAILPVQDVLGLDESARMNVPSSSQNNWAWRLVAAQLNKSTEKLLREWTRLYNR